MTPIGNIRALISSGLVEIALVISLAACADEADEGRGKAAAEDLVRTYLARVVSGQGDRGWSLLHPYTQRSHYGGDETAYVDEVAEQDWDAFDWEIANVQQDDPGAYEVVLSVEGEPPALIARLATWMQGPTSPGPTFYVRFEQLGGTGIYEIDP